MQRREDENRGLRRVSMNIQEHLEHTLFNRHILLQIVSNNLHFMDPPMLQRILIIVRKEMPVHIFALQIGAVVAADDAVGVDDGADPPLEDFAEFVGDHVARAEEVY